MKFIFLRDNHHKTLEEKELMSEKPYASAIGSLMYVTLCIGRDICYAIGIVNRYKSDPEVEHWTTRKHILKYPKRTWDYMLVYSSGSFGTLGYTDFDFQGDIDSSKITYEENLTNLFTKTLFEHVFEKHVNCMGLRSVPSFRVSRSWLPLCYRSKTTCNFIYDLNGINFSNSYTRVVSYIRFRLIMQYMIM